MSECAVTEALVRELVQHLEDDHAEDTYPVSSTFTECAHEQTIVICACCGEFMGETS